MVTVRRAHPSVFKKTENNMCWRGRGKWGPVHGGWEGKTVPPLETMMWRSPKRKQNGHGTQQPHCVPKVVNTGSGTGPFVYTHVLSGVT